MNGDGSYDYVPGANFHGEDSFTYTVTDADSGESLTQTVTITVNTVNDVPTVVNNDSVTTSEDTAINIDVLANDTDSDSAVSVVASVTDGVNGTVSINNDGTVMYTPAANFTGTDTFTYTNAEGNEGTVTVNVTPTPDVEDGIEIQLGDPVSQTGGLSDLSGADGKNTYSANGITLTAPENMNFNSGNGLGVGPSKAFRISGNDYVDVEYDAPLQIDTINLWVKNNVEEAVKISASLEIDEQEYTLVAIGREAGNGKNALGYFASLELFDSSSNLISTISSTSASEISISAEIGDENYAFDLATDFSSGNDSDTLTLTSDVAFSNYRVSSDVMGAGNGFTISQIGTDTSTPLFFEYPLDLGVVSSDHSGNVEYIDGTFIIGGLKEGDSIVLPDVAGTIVSADADGNAQIDSSDYYDAISNGSDGIKLRTSEALPDDYQLSISVSSTENGVTMYTMDGGTANDVFVGGDNADYLSGGLGEDTLTGGSGDDVFAWNLADTDPNTPSIDVITDFGTGNDVINIADLFDSDNSASLIELLNGDGDNDLSITVNTDGYAVISVTASNGATQDIVLSGLPVDDITTGDYASYNESNDLQNVINDLVTSGKLIID
jgi:hypothetical protein